MIFLSSQPDDYYFLWQLKLQIFNFKSVGINGEDIHVLIGYNPKKGLSKDYESFIIENADVKIYAYPDLRENKIYLPALRWHIIAQHLNNFPYLKNECIFLHDSDVLFKQQLELDTIKTDDTWYASDAASYLNTEYIINTIGEEGFTMMAEVVGVDTQLIKANDFNAGGAQYIVKNIETDFLKKVECDSEALYKVLLEINRKNLISNIKKPIQAWCADMWVFWWAAIIYNKEFRIHKELDFAWANSPLSFLNEKKILHYTGASADKEEDNFNKSLYIDYDPFYQNLDSINPESCSSFVRDEIKKYRKATKAKTDLTDFTFILTVNNNNVLDNVYAAAWNIAIFFKTNILIVGSIDETHIKLSKLPANTVYKYVEDGVNFFSAKFLKEISTAYVILYNSEIIVSVANLIQATTTVKIKSNYCQILDIQPLKVDRLMTAMFTKMLDSKLFEENENKLLPDSSIVQDHVIFLKTLYLQQIASSINSLKAMNEVSMLLSKFNFVINRRIVTGYSLAS